MGAAESKQEEQINRNHDDHEERRKKESSMGSGTALAVGVGAGLLAFAVGLAAGAALLGVAWGVSRYRSSSSGERVDNHDLAVADYPYESAPISNSKPEPKIKLKILTYNVCFREDYEIQERMKAIGGLVQHHYPHFICFQLSRFHPIDTTEKRGCPDPSDSNSQDHHYTKERQRQAKDALAILQHYPNVVFCGDMNWNEKTDGEFPLPEGWLDAWTELRGEEKGYTFDTKSNPMLNGRPCLQMRLDRILCNFEGFRLEGIDIIGQKPIPNVTYQWKNKSLPVLPSDHYGLLLTICTY